MEAPPSHPRPARYSRNSSLDGLRYTVQSSRNVCAQVGVKVEVKPFVDHVPVGGLDSQPEAPAEALDRAALPATQRSLAQRGGEGARDERDEAAQACR